MWATAGTHGPRQCEAVHRLRQESGQRILPARSEWAGQRGGVVQGPVRLGSITFVVRAVMEGTSSCKEEVHKSIGTKVQVGEV